MTTRGSTPKRKSCQHKHVDYVGKGGYQCRQCQLFGFKDNGVFTVITVQNVYEAMRHENMSGSTPGGLRGILEQFENNIYTRLGEGSKDGLTFDQAIAAIGALVPEKHGTAGYDYWRGHDDAIDQIQRNFKGE